VAQILQPVSQKHRCGAGRARNANSPQPHEALVLPTGTAGDPLPSPTSPNAQNLVGQALGREHLPFIDLTSPRMLLSPAAGSARQERGEAGVQARPRFSPPGVCMVPGIY